MEEERRIAYVGITRAKRKLHITNTFHRMLYGQTSYNKPSRFVEEIPRFLCEISSSVVPATERFTYSSNYYNKSKTSRPQFTAKPVANKSTFNFSVGDSVNHSAFGDGKIVKATPMGNDVLLEIVFDSVGTKKLMATFARLKKI